MGADVVVVVVVLLVVVERSVAEVVVFGVFEDVVPAGGVEALLAGGFEDGLDDGGLDDGGVDDGGHCGVEKFGGFDGVDEEGDVDEGGVVMHGLDDGGVDDGGLEDGGFDGPGFGSGLPGFGGVGVGFFTLLPLSGRFGSVLTLSPYVLAHLRTSFT